MAKMAEDDPRGMMPCKHCGKPSRLPIHPECLADYDAGKARTSPAFPMPYTRENSGPAGLTKREYAAIQIMAGLQAATNSHLRTPSADAGLAVMCADALLEALK